MKNLKEFVLDQDIYGHPISVHFKGKNTYNTWLGVLCTLMVNAIVFKSFLVLGGGFIDGSRQDEKVNTEKYDRFDSEAMNLEDMGVKFYVFPSLYRVEYDEWNSEKYNFEPLRP